MSTPEPLSDAQFAAVEEAMAQTDLGRAFLDEYARRTGVVRAAEIMDAISEMRESLISNSSSTHIDILRRELQEMSASIMQTRNEIAAIKPQEAGNNRIMAATGELDVIVSATERATSDILTSAEQIQDHVNDLRESGAAEQACDDIEGHVINIFTACSFQDITGQRTIKVVNALRYLEQRVNTMIEIWGVEGIDPAAAPPDTTDDRPDAHLLEGPQMEGEGSSQDDIDRLLQEMLGGSDQPASEPEEMAVEA
jgi:chemotaxis regulatin CheY-phosphate phosphatase CheZ